MFYQLEDWSICVCLLECDEVILGRLRRDNHPSVKLLINVDQSCDLCKEVFWNVIKIELGVGEGLTLLDFTVHVMTVTANVKLSL